MLEQPPEGDVYNSKLWGFFPVGCPVVQVWDVPTLILSSIFVDENLRVLLFQSLRTVLATSTPDPLDEFHLSRQ